MVGQPLPGNRDDCKAWEESGARAAVGRTLTIADGGYPGTGLVMPHRRRRGEDLPDWKEAHNKSHKQVRARVEHVFARMKTGRSSRTGPHGCDAPAVCTARRRPGRIRADSPLLRAGRAEPSRGGTG